MSTGGILGQVITPHKFQNVPKFGFHSSSSILTDVYLISQNCTVSYLAKLHCLSVRKKWPSVSLCAIYIRKCRVFFTYSVSLCAIPQCHRASCSYGVSLCTICYKLHCLSVRNQQLRCLSLRKITLCLCARSVISYSVPLCADYIKLRTERQCSFAR